VPVGPLKADPKGKLRRGLGHEFVAIEVIDPSLVLTEEIILHKNHALVNQAPRNVWAIGIH
jgi:hypothetical protein